MLRCSICLTYNPAIYKILKILVQTKISRRVSRVLFSRRFICSISVIYLGLRLPAGSSHLPFPAGPFGPVARAAPTGIYLMLQPMRFTPPGITTGARGLLPHVFTLPIPNKFGAEVIFCGTFCTLPHLAVSKHGALCCPDFPPLKIKERRTFLLQAKVGKNCWGI